MNKNLLPPLEQKTAERLFEFLGFLKHIVHDNSESIEERKKMNRVVFQILDLIDGGYDEFPTMDQIVDGVCVSSCMHEYFIAFMEDGLS
jgi:hypothetical protein